MIEPEDTAPTSRTPLPLERIAAVIFDMDGVVTDTASLHSRCWKLVFDEFLRGCPETAGADLRPFDDDDYLRFVDGKPRYDGVESFLSSRHLHLGRGSPSDPPGHGTVCALGNLKDHEFERLVAEDGVAVFDSTVDLIRSLREHRVRTALISSSWHARALLESAGIDDLFDAIVDGIDSDALHLPGKPDPTVFLTAARAVSIPPSRAAIVEDAIAGVQAGHRGSFGLVIGIDRGHHAEELRAQGADLVVTDLSALQWRFSPSEGSR